MQCYTSSPEFSLFKSQGLFKHGAVVVPEDGRGLLIEVGLHDAVPVLGEVHFNGLGARFDGTDGFPIGRIMDPCPYQILVAGLRGREDLTRKGRIEEVLSSDLGVWIVGREVFAVLENQALGCRAEHVAVTACVVSLIKGLCLFVVKGPVLFLSRVSVSFCSTYLYEAPL